MTTFQRIVKYIALAFAGCLSLFIISASVFGISLFVNYFSDEDDVISEKLTPIESNLDSIRNLDVDLNTSKLTIKQGNEFKVETNNNRIKSYVKDDKLVIKDQTKSLHFNKNSEMVIYVPSDYSFNSVDLNMGAGVLKVGELITDELIADFGAGEATLEKVDVKIKSKINVGVGSVSIKNSILNNSEIELGVGEFIFSGLLLNNNDIDCGVGETTLEIDDTLDNYRIKAEKGIGSIKINYESIKNDTTIGNGTNLLDIDGGVGSITVKFQK